MSHKEAETTFQVSPPASSTGLLLTRPWGRRSSGMPFVDAARRVIVKAGYEEYKHALGHGLGLASHGSALLGALRRHPVGVVEAGNVFTLEWGVSTEAGYIGLEEEVLVTEQGCVFLTTPPEARIRLISAIERRAFRGWTTKRCTPP